MTPSKTSISQESSNQLRALHDNAQCFRVFTDEPSQPNSQWTELKEELVAQSLRIGLSEPPSIDELVDICRFVQREFKDFNILEVKNAFSLYAAQKLDFRDNPYNKLSSLFIGNVLSSYRRYRNSKVQPKSILNTVKLEKVNKKEYYETKLFKPYQELLKGKYTFTDIDEKYLYRSLDKLGIVMATNEEKRDIFADVKARNPRKYREEEGAYIKRLQQKSKEIAFRQWIQGKALNEEDIETEIKERL